MRTHRIIFWITLLLFVIFAPIVVNLNINEDVKNIFIGIICSSLVAAVVELPNLLNYKSTSKNTLYSSLLYTKLFLLQYNSDIDCRLKEKEFMHNQYGGYYLNNISNNINIFNQSDETIFYYIDPRKKILLDSKKDFYNLYNVIRNDSIYVDIFKINMQLNNNTINDVHMQLKKLKKSNNNLIEKIDFVAKKILSNKQLNYFIDNSNRIKEALKNEAIY